MTSRLRELCLLDGHAVTGDVLAETTVTPTCNIGNKASNSFSGSSKVVLPFSVTSPTRVIIEVILNVAVYGDVMLSDISISKAESTGIGEVEPVEGNTYQLDIRPLTPGLVFQRIIVDLGGHGKTFLHGVESDYTRK